MSIEEIKAACNRPSTLAIKLTAADGASITLPLGRDYDDLFHEWLTNGANEHPLEYWVRYWRTGTISDEDLREQNTFAFGFLEALGQSEDYPYWLGDDFKTEVVLVTP